MCPGRPERSFVGMTTKRISPIAVLLALLCAAALWPAAGQAEAAGRTKTIKVFVKTQSLTLTDSSGTVVDRQPQPGDVLDVYSLDFYGNHKKHSKRFAGSEHLRCVFGTGEPDCTSTVALGRSLLVFRGDKLVDGAGRFFGATGRVLSTKEVPGGTDAVAKIKLAKH
jgi:hypothetical protein